MSELATRSPQGSLDLYDINEMKKMYSLAEYYVKSGALPPTENAFTLSIKLQAGREMGISPLQSIKSFYIVNGQINIWGSAVTNRFREHGWAISYEETPNSCKCTVTKGDEKITETYTFAEAVASGYTTSQRGEKIGWREGTNRRLKLRYGALSLILKTRLAELMGPAQDVQEVYEDITPEVKLKTPERFAKVEPDAAKVEEKVSSPPPQVVSVEDVPLPKPPEAPPVAPPAKGQAASAVLEKLRTS